MEFEFWWLLAFPLFFSLGWLAARIDLKQLLSESRNLPTSYFKGLNFLLNEEPDKAIEAFTEVVKTNSDTVELNFALGGLFRRRGETERAIRMHQRLLERDDLGDDNKLMALFELGQDYLKAGLLDRAEQLFMDLLPTSYAKPASEFLLEIYQQEKDWGKAIEVAERMNGNSTRDFHADIAHFYCEWAIAEAAHSNPEAARKHLAQALEVNRHCARATILIGELDMAEGNAAGAIQAWKRVETQSPAHLPLVAQKLLGAFSDLGRREEGFNLLRDYMSRYPSLDMLDVVYNATLEAQGPEAAYRLVRDELRRNATLQGLDRLLEAQLIEAPSERRQDMQLIKNLVHQHSQRLALYRCDNCGFKAKRYYWRCPACGGWETFPPRRAEEEDSVPARARPA